MSICYGNDYEYANDRLRGTVITYKGHPIHVERIRGGGLVEGFFLATNRFNGERIHLNDCDLSPIRLGYINLKRDAVYITRMPQRQYRQGLNQRQIVLSKKKRNMPPRLIFSKPLTDMLSDRYPDIDTCLDLLQNDEKTSVAFSKKFSLTKDNRKSIGLEYRGKIVGRVNNSDNDIVLEKKFLFLKELLEEVRSEK